jgi:hypothetical protein
VIVQNLITEVVTVEVTVVVTVVNVAEVGIATSAENRDTLQENALRMKIITGIKVYHLNLRVPSCVITM